MNTRHKKRNNARTLTIRTQWAKYYRDDNIEETTFMIDDLCKTNPNKRCGFYTPTCPDNVLIKLPDPQLDNEELEYLKSLWLEEDIII